MVEEAFIDAQGLRLNVGIIIVNHENKVFWAKRIKGRNAWQFPQGGINQNETPRQAMYRELYEELGLLEKDVEFVSVTKKWMTYLLPKRFQRQHSVPLCVGQKQKWFLLRLVSPDETISLDVTDKPEFSEWHWVDYWHAPEHVISFKKNVYRRALQVFEPILFNGKKK